MPLLGWLAALLCLAAIRPLDIAALLLALTGGALIAGDLCLAAALLPLAALAARPRWPVLAVGFALPLALLLVPVSQLGPPLALLAHLAGAALAPRADPALAPPPANRAG